MIRRGELVLAGVLALLWSDAAQAQEAEGRCMERHLREAIALNRERMPRYDSLTGGQSRAVSRRMIRAEQAALAAAWVIDRRAETWLAHGVRIVCDDFVPMEHTPSFQGRADPPGAPFVAADPRRIRRAVALAFRAGGFGRAAETIEHEIERLGEAPAYHCMTRHLLESALRVANLAPVHAEAARARGLPPTDRLSRALLDLHLATLGEAARLDRSAAPLQAEGVPIVCRDVPPIPAR